MAVDNGKNGHSEGAALHELFREVFHLQAVLAEAMDAVHEQSGMRTSHKRIAEILDREKTATVPDVAAKLNVSRQFVQTVCNELNAQGLLVFMNNPRHKRSKLTALTDEGRTLLHDSRDKESQIIQDLLPNLDSDAVDQATNLLRGLKERMEGRV